MTSLMSRLSGRPCPACAASDVEVLHSCRFILADDHPLKAGYDVVLCTLCGMAFGDPIPPQSAFDTYYERLSKYTDPESATGGGVLAWDDRRVAASADFLASRCSRRDAHIVDIGCASGGILRYLAAMGFTRLTGIDPAPACVAAVAQIEGVTAGLGSFFAMPKDLERADLVVLSHVMEHVRDVQPALHVVKNMLTADGLVYVEVPDATRYVEHLVAPYLDFNTEHINHFSLESLSLAARSAGLDVIDAGTKLAPSSPTTDYPCVWVLARGQQHDHERSTQFDGALKQSLGRYVDESQRLLQEISRRWIEHRLDDSEVVIWGTGQTTAILMANTSLGQARIRYFTDSNERFVGQRIQGVTVVAPRHLETIPDVPIVVGSLLHQSAIVDSIRARGLTNPIITLGPIS